MALGIRAVSHGGLVIFLYLFVMRPPKVEKGTNKIRYTKKINSIAMKEDGLPER